MTENPLSFLGASDLLAGFTNGVPQSLTFCLSGTSTPLELFLRAEAARQGVALTVQTTYPTHKYVRDLTLRYLPEASHFVQQDAPDLVNRLLAHWLRGEPVPEEGEAEGVHVATRA